jgi:hypothetical protein
VQDGYDYPDNWWETAIFQEDWFGEAVPPTEDHSISKGYWSTIALPDGGKYKETWDMTVEKSVNPFVNAYGVMRSAWNNNPTNHISRRNTTYGKSLMSLPSCEFIHGCYQSSTMEKVSRRLTANKCTPFPSHDQL